MKTLYFDCSSGISGNMVLGALTEIIGDEQYLIEELKKLNMDGYKIEISKLAGVNKIIEESSLNEKVKDLAKRIFLRVAKAESKVHDKPLEEVHFHEVGAIDSIIDIVGTAILINKINPDKIGWGAGSKDLKIPNVLKVYYGDKDVQEQNEKIAVMETNIDDCSGEIVGYTQEKLFQNGALDVFYTPIFMKKNRPAYKLTVICKKEDILKLQNIIFKETTTIGIRYHFEFRTELERELIEIDTKYGKLKAKKVVNNGETFIYPEYESMKDLAEKNNIPLKELYKLDELEGK